MQRLCHFKDLNNLIDTFNEIVLVLIGPWLWLNYTKAIQYIMLYLADPQTKIKWNLEP